MKGPKYTGLNAFHAIEVRVVWLHADQHLTAAGCLNRVDAGQWHPFVMNFH